MESNPAEGRCDRALVILGASVRALAESAKRAGWTVYAADLFRDLDLVAVSQEAVRARDGDAGYPVSLATAAAGFPASAPWCYTGGLENHPDLIAAVAALRPLAGNTAAGVRKVRDPVLLAAVVTAAGGDFPDTRQRPEGLPTDGSYLVKPLASAGGRGITPWTTATAASWPMRRGKTDQPQQIWQRFIAGTPTSASYVMSAGSARLLGLTRQLVGAQWCHAPRFAWCGGVTDPRPDLVDGFERIGAAIAAACGLVGAIGVDAVVDESGRISVLEVNPRPTASMELFERSTGISIAGSHMAACGHASNASAAPQTLPFEPGWHWAKAVLFANRDALITPQLGDSLHHIAAAWASSDGGLATIADIPAPGQVVARGSPICSFFARGRSHEDALERLRDRVAAGDRLFTASPPATQALDRHAGRIADDARAADRSGSGEAAG